jgi:MFS family permease
MQMVSQRSAWGFYGWKVVFACSVGVMLGASTLPMFTFGVLLKPLTETFGWSRGEASAAILVYNVVSIVIGPIIGRIIDRYGAKQFILFSMFCLGAAFIFAQRMSSDVRSLYLVYGLMGLVGAGTSAMAYAKVVSAWFARKRGLALGITLAGSGFGAAILPYATSLAVTHFGWSGAYLFLGGSILLVGFPVVAALLKDRPDMMGLSPDGDAGNAAAAEATDTESLSMREIFKRREYWLLAVAFALMGSALAAINLHMVSMLTDAGMKAETAALAQGMVGIGTIFGRILMGFLMDRFFAVRVAVLFMLGPIIAIPLLASGASPEVAFACALAIGFATGAEIDLLAYVTGRYFGLRNFAQTYALLFSTFVIFGATSGAVLGRVQDVTGSYAQAAYVLSALLVAAGAVLLMLPRYRQFE